MLHGHFENTLVCHFVSHESPRLPTKTPALTRLGAVVFKIFPPNNSGHLTYMHLEFDGHTQQATLFDPVSLTVESRYLLHPHQDKAARYQGITLFDMPLNIQHVYRADQCYNEHDCGRFSAIYLLYALSGKNISDLSRDEIYQGFKRWITGPRGLLSYQKVHDKKAGTKLQKAIENKSADLAQESEKVMEAIRRESDDIMLQCRTNFSEQQALQDELTLKNKQFDEEIEKLKVEQNYESAFKKKEERKEMNEIFYQKFKVLATKGDDVTKLFAAITAKTNQCSETFTQTSLAALAPLSEQLMRESAAREQRAHLMKKTCFATFTTPWRTVVDWILRYL